MDAETLKSIQAPLKRRYVEEPAAAQITLRASGDLDAAGIACGVATAKGMIEAGLHPLAGGDGSGVCSGDMLLEALVACAGVTLRAVATSLSVEVRGGTIHAEGDLDGRGALGLDDDVPVGFGQVRLRFDLDTDADEATLALLTRLTERFCVVAQTLQRPPGFEIACRRAGPAAPA